jgi:chromosome partitioning protein
MRAIALANQKGGVGKTTSAASLGACLALRGRKVLLVDIDPQSNLSIHLGVNIHEDRPSMYALMIGQATALQVIRHTGVANLDIIPSDIDLAGAEIELVGVVGRETVLKEALSPVLDAYDYLMIDCPPSLGLLTLNALTTVRELLIPLQTEFFALHGMSKLLETVAVVKRRLNPELEITGIIACMYDGRLHLAREVLANIRQYFGDKVFKTLIRKNVRLAESPSYGKVIFQYDGSSSGAQDYQSLADEVMAQESRLMVKVAAPDARDASAPPLEASACPPEAPACPPEALAAAVLVTPTAAEASASGDGGAEGDPNG